MTTVQSTDKKPVGSSQEKGNSWSKSDEVWQRVNAILNSGVLATVNEKQLETRRYLEDVEDRFIDIIKKSKIELEPESLDLPDTAAYLPSGNISQEIHSAIGAINLLNDKQLKFRLTAFVDDYRRILEMNREQEQNELLDSLEEYFEKGSYDFVEQKEETQEMMESLAVVEKEVQKTKDIKNELLSRSRQIKHERDRALFYQTREKEDAIQSDKPKPPPTTDECLDTIFDILQKPRVMQAIGVEDFLVLRQNVFMVAAPKPPEVKKPLNTKDHKE